MEHYKISKLLDNSTMSKFVTKKWVEINYLSSGQCPVNKNITFKTSMLRSYLRDCNDAYIVVKGTIDLLVAAADENDKAEKDISKINSTLSINDNIKFLENIH